ncbi:MAG: InlB B-repeat-containing protein [Bacteroidales bacterium]|nr:InlB B-repeat-containing protein [Bacteroidales bacterium]
MSKKKYIVVLFFAVVAAISLAFAIGTGCKKNKTYEIKFDTGTHAQVESIYARKDEVITLPEPAKEDGWVFKAWYLESDYSGTEYPASSSYTVTGKTTFHGKYNVEAEIDVDLDGGTLDETHFALEVGKNVSEYMNQFVPVKDRHQFDYWADEDGNAIDSTLLMPEEGLKLKAVYKVEVSAQVWVWNDDNTAEHYEQYDRISYESVGETQVVLTPNTPSGLQMSSNQNSGEGNDTLAVVDEDPDKNVVKIYYDRQNITYSFTTNYPTETGLSDTVVSSGECVFGDLVTVPTGLSCYGYILVGWSTSPTATVPDCKVDLLTGNTMMWSSGDYAYVRSGEVATDECMPEYRTTTFYGVWYRGYFDMFGSYDVVYDFGDGDTVYLSRGGVFWESSSYNSSTEIYTFTNSYDGAQMYQVYLRDDGYFVFWDYGYTYDKYVRVYADYIPSYGAMWITESGEYFQFNRAGNVDYFDEDGYQSYGVYGQDEDGYITLTFTSGTLEGKVYTILLVALDDAGDTMGYIVRDDSHVGDVITFGGVGYDGAVGGYEGIIDEDSYYIELSGFNTCTYYMYGEKYSYYYILDGDDLMLFSTTYDESYYGYPLGGIYRYSSDFDRWLYYYSQLDGEIILYEVDGETQMGTVTLDGMYSGTVKLTDGVSYDVIFAVTSYAIGDVVMLFSDLSGYYYTTAEFFIYDYEVIEEGYTYSYRYFLTKLPSTYSESYYYDGGAEPSSYQILGLDENGNTATLYLYGYSYLAGYYIYFSVWTGTYEVVTNDECGFTYYKISGITPTDDYDFYEISGVYYATYSYDELMAMTEVGFIPAQYVELYYGMAYYTDVNVWYYYKTGTGDGEKTTTYSTTYSAVCGDSISVTVDDVTYTGTSITVVGDYLVYGTLTDGNETTLDFEGFITDRNDYIDGNRHTFTVTTIKISVKYADGDTSNERYEEEEKTETYEENIDVKFTESCSGNTFEIVENIYCYYYGYTTGSNGGFTEGEYFYYDAVNGSLSDVTYVENGVTYTGAITAYTEDGRYVTTATGRVVYVFTGTQTNSTEKSFRFVAADLATDDGQTYSIFVKLSDGSTETRYTGNDGSSFVIDETGLGATYTKGGTTSVVNSYVVHEGTDCGYYNNGYITFALDGVYYILDFVQESDECSYDYTLRGQEYWYRFYVVDNQILKSYYLSFDGYGALKVWTYDDAAGWNEVGAGTYEVTDTVVNYTWWYTPAGGGDPVVSYDAEGVLDYVSGDTYAGLFVNRSEWEITLVNSTDWSVLVLDGYGDAVRFTNDGSVEYGVFTILDEKYFYYVDYSGETVIEYSYDLTKGIVSPITYSTDLIYFTSDMTQSAYFTDYGRVTFDGYTYYYYVRETEGAYIYYIPDDETKANEFGYTRYGPFSTSSTTLTLGSTEYMKLGGGTTGETVTLTRNSCDAGNFGAFSGTTTQDSTTGRYGYEKIYTLESITFRIDGDEFYSEGTVVLTLYGDVDDEKGEKTVVDTQEVGIGFSREAIGDGKYSISFDLYLADYADYVLYSYDDTLLYGIEVDLSAMEYKVTSMEFYLPMLSYEYMYLTYLADVNYDLYAMYMEMYYLAASFGGTEEEIYEYYYAAYESYMNWANYSSLADYYYSEAYLIWQFDSNCTYDPSDMWLTGFFMPYLITDAEGNEITFEMEKVYLTSEGYTISFVGADGYTYTLTFIPEDLFLSEELTELGYNYSTYAFDTVAFQWFTDYYADDGSDGYYVVTTGTLIYSDYYYDYEGEIWSIGLTHFENGETEGTPIDAIVMVELDGDLYFVAEETENDETKTVYYKVTYTFDANGEVTAVAVEKSASVTVYTATVGSDTLYLDVFESEEIKTIVLVYKTEAGIDGTWANTYYLVTECADYDSDGDGDADSYFVTLSDGTMYIVSLGICSNATVTEIEEIFTTEMGSNKYVIANGSDGGRVYYKITYAGNGEAAAAVEGGVKTYTINTDAGSLDVLDGVIVLVYSSNGFTDGNGGTVTAKGYYLVTGCTENGEDGTYSVTLTDGSMYTVTLDTSAETATLKYGGNMNDGGEPESTDSGAEAATASIVENQFYALK